MPSQDNSCSAIESSRVESRRALRLALLLFLFLNFVYLATSTGRARSIDEIDPVLQSESLLIRHSTAIPQAVGSGIWFGKRDVHGMPRSAWPFGHAVMVLPWSAIGHHALVKAPGMPGDIADLAVSAATCWSNGTYAALAVAAAFLIFVRLGLAEREALGCALVLAFATPLFVYSGWLFSEPVSTAMFVIAALLLFGSQTERLWRTVAGALILGFSIHVRPANALTVFVFIAAATFVSARRDRGMRHRTATIIATVLAVSGVLYLVRNYALFGSALDFGVPTTAEGGKELDSWHNPMWRGVLGFLFSPGKSVWLFCPPMVLGVLGITRLWQRNRALTVLAVGAPVANLILYSFRTQWEGSYCYGPRYLLPSLVLLCAPMAALVQDPPRWFKPVFWTTTVVGFVVQVIGLSTNIMEDMVLNHYYVGNWDYRMSYSPISGQLRLIWKYLHQSPAGPGFGWDRWFVFLHQEGASTRLVYGIELVFVAGAIVFGVMVWSGVSGVRGARRSSAQ